MAVMNRAHFSVTSTTASCSFQRLLAQEGLEMHYICSRRLNWNWKCYVPLQYPLNKQAITYQCCGTITSPLCPPASVGGTDKTAEEPLISTYTTSPKSSTNYCRFTLIRQSHSSIYGQSAAHCIQQWKNADWFEHSGFGLKCGCALMQHKQLNHLDTFNIIQLFAIDCQK